MSDHSKGPWTLYQGKNQTFLSAPEWQQFAKVVTCMKYSHPDDVCNDAGKANARLMVSAPDLLDALRECLRTLTQEVTGADHELATQNAYRVIQRAAGLEEAESCLPEESIK